jgi:hypothetical protein
MSAARRRRRRASRLVGSVRRCRTNARGSTMWTNELAPSISRGRGWWAGAAWAGAAWAGRRGRGRRGRGGGGGDGVALASLGWQVRVVASVGEAVEHINARAAPSSPLTSLCLCRPRHARPARPAASHGRRTARTTRTPSSRQTRRSRTHARGPHRCRAAAPSLMPRRCCPTAAALPPSVPAPRVAGGAALLRLRRRGGRLRQRLHALRRRAALRLRRRGASHPPLPAALATRLPLPSSAGPRRTAARCLAAWPPPHNLIFIPTPHTRRVAAAAAPLMAGGALRSAGRLA